MPEAFARKAFLGSFVFICLSAVFAYGVAVGKYRLWPYSTLDEMVRVSRSIYTFGWIVPSNLLQEAAADAPPQRITIHNAAAMAGGYYAFLGWDDHGGHYAAWLFDSRGAQVHTWSIDYYALDPDGPSGDSDSPHGFKPLPDGSILVNFDKGDVMARLDSCGDPLWVKDGIYHHSIEGAEDGSYWTWRAEGTAYGQHQYLVNFEPQSGRTLKEVSLTEEIIARMGQESLVFGVRIDHPFVRLDAPQRDRADDIFHPNDIDILRSDLAARFPGFEGGDLLLSFRNLNLVAVINPESYRVKWWSSGPWRFQHDPDFTIDGNISIYNNNSNIGRSEIVKIHPGTRRISNVLRSSDFRFYSHSMGKHQYLPNGNLLIVIPGEGRVVELSGDGKKVFEFNNLSTKAHHNGHVENGLWVPANFFTQPPQCRKQTREG